ncbi:Acyl carrier protein [Frankia canadensis]|uniref:Acyl carrier protein n=1 Tax=Frankia canadensis TaxID=1836972 RepID=A0A2I2KJY1_9ACTN|nr:acyl carrier protein [Frankia canadensis]SNQ45979.1 Acyl carrier protein [Frankia canadensis]SOU53269.1 Acyl carrier protein [Frankia canadensis]
MPQLWTAEALLDFLVEAAGLPPADRPSDLGVTFVDIGLDSLAYLQLSAEVAGTFGVDLPAEMPEGYTLAEILDTVNATAGQREPV